VYLTQSGRVVIGRTRKAYRILFSTLSIICVQFWYSDDIFMYLLKIEDF